MAYQQGQTAIVVAVPAVEPVVDRWRQRHDASAQSGVPAHITIVYPFLDASRIDSAAADLQALFARERPFTVEFRRCGRFPDVLYLDPEPAERFVQLTDAAVARWPEAPPYDGAFDVVVPHLTVAHDVDEETLALVEADVAAKLPVRAGVAEAWLISFAGGRWERHIRLPFGAR